jgi:hypothetical protein
MLNYKSYQQKIEYSLQIAGSIPYLNANVSKKHTAKICRR